MAAHNVVTDQPLLYQVASGLLSEGLIAPPLRRVIKNQRNARTVLAYVTHFDLDRHFVYGVTPDGRKLHRRYDTLVVAGGATHAYFGNDHWAGSLVFTKNYPQRVITFEQARAGVREESA